MKHTTPIMISFNNERQPRDLLN